MVNSTVRFILSLALRFYPCVFNPLSIAITSLGEERELVSVLFVRLFVLLVMVCVTFLFLLVSEIGCDVIVALPGLFFFTLFSFETAELISCSQTGNKSLLIWSWSRI